VGIRVIMLEWLKIQNFAIVSELDLDCPDKMSAFTGETGAGKSIMIDAIDLLLGARADASVVRPNTSKCEISAQFIYDHASQITQWLLENDFLQADDVVVLRRIISQEGRSKYFINGQASTALQIKTLGQLLVNIHGQHQQQSLLSTHNHREHLDDFSAAHQLKQQVKFYYQEYIQAKNQLNNLNGQNQSLEQCQLWQYQLNELLELNPQDGEIQELHQEQHLLHNAHHYLESLHKIEHQITEADAAVLKQLHAIAHDLKQLPQEHNALQLIDSALIQVEECLSEVRSSQRHIQINPERLAEVESRMSRWHQLARKFQIDIAELPQYAIHLQSLIDNVNNIQSERAHLEKTCEQAREKYYKYARQLSEHRQQYAPELAQAIENIIHELGMPHAQLVIDIQPLAEMYSHGIDKVEYLIATNPGGAPAPLAKIASGGELSRISLSIHLITAQRGATPTLLFDEVDVGIGGATAMKVGKRLRELGERLQIFCVTHQPQVASCAHHHFLVSKMTADNATFSAIQYLNQQGRVEEIARMLGGLSITEQTKNNAKELLNIL